MPFGLPFICCLSIVDHGYKPVPVVPDVKDHVAVYKIGILEHAANIIKIVPANRLDNDSPGFDFVRRIWVVFRCLPQMLKRNDMHSTKSTSQYVKCQADYNRNPFLGGQNSISSRIDSTRSHSGQGPPPPWNYLGLLFDPSGATGDTMRHTIGTLILKQYNDSLAERLMELT